MTKTLSLLTVSLLALAAGSAQAALVTTTSLFSPTPVPGTATPIALQGVSPVPSGTNFSGTGFSVSFASLTAGQGVVQGALSAIYAIPVAGAIPASSSGTPEYLTGDFGSTLTTNAAASGKYLSTGAAGGSITISFTKPENSLGLLWGSIDHSNNLAFYNGTTLIGDVTGTSVQGTPGFVSNGFQGPGGSSYVTVNDTTGTFTSVVATSGVVSFEFTGVVGSTQSIPVPEPVSLALLGTGLLAMGAFRRKQG